MPDTDDADWSAGPGAQDEEPLATPAERWLARAAADAAPAAAALLTEHTTRHGELLPIYYLDSLGEWYLATWRSRERAPARFAEAGAVAAVLDAAFTTEPELREPIAVGFLEMFTDLPDTEQAAASASLPAALRAEYQRMADWRP